MSAFDPGRAAARLPPHNAVRAFAERALAGARPGADCVEPLQNALIGTWRRAAERQVAAWLLPQASLDSDTRRTVAKALEREVDRELHAGVAWSAWRWYWRTQLLVLTLVVGYGLYVARSESWLPREFAEFAGTMVVVSLLSVCLTFLSAPISVPLSYLLDGSRRNRLQLLIQTLGDLKEPASAATLARAYRDWNSGGVAERALRQVLPHVTEECYGHMPAGFGRKLVCALAWPNSALRIDILRAIARAADGSALRPLQEFRDYALTRFSPAEAEALADTLVVLRERAAAEAAPNVLLRAAGALLPGEETLLRATNERGDAGSAMLLRASEADGHGGD